MFPSPGSPRLTAHLPTCFPVLSPAPLFAGSSLLCRCPPGSEHCLCPEIVEALSSLPCPICLAGLPPHAACSRLFPLSCRKTAFSFYLPGGAVPSATGCGVGESSLMTNRGNTFLGPEHRGHLPPTKVCSPRALRKNVPASLQWEGALRGQVGQHGFEILFRVFGSFHWKKIAFTASQGPSRELPARKSTGEGVRDPSLSQGRVCAGHRRPSYVTVHDHSQTSKAGHYCDFPFPLDLILRDPQIVSVGMPPDRRLHPTPIQAAPSPALWPWPSCLPGGLSLGVPPMTPSGYRGD